MVGAPREFLRRAGHSSSCNGGPASHTAGRSRTKTPLITGYLCGRCGHLGRLWYRPTPPCTAPHRPNTGPADPIRPVTPITAPSVPTLPHTTLIQSPSAPQRDVPHWPTSHTALIPTPTAQNTYRSNSVTQAPIHPASPYFAPTPSHSSPYRVMTFSYRTIRKKM